MRNFRLDDESGHQEALFSWAAYRTEIMPELQYMYHVPNGGKRDKATAAVLIEQYLLHSDELTKEQETVTMR